MKNEVIIEKLDHYGKGIARIDGMLIFVDGALPGETVKIEKTVEKKKFCEAKTVDIIKRSEMRVNPICPYYGECGGCNIMHMSYPQQLIFKEDKVKEVLKKFAGFDNVKGIVGTDYLYYRNKVTLKVNKKIGYYKSKSYNIVPINECFIADKRINSIISRLKCMNLGNTKEIVIRASKNELMIVFDGIIKDDISLLDDVTTIISDNHILKGKGYITEEINGIKYMISPTSFFQVNTNGMINLYNQVLKYASLKGNENLLDLYCGTGTIGIYLSRYCNKVFGIEINEEAIKDALENKKINNLTNIDFQAGDVKDVLTKNSFKPDIIVVDPPRAGLDKSVIDEIIALNSNRLIYVSCDVVTLARDLNILKERYNIIECTPVDMFPNTYHVENVVLLDRK